MHYYSHHISDFNNATRHLTRVERSLYRDLIELYYDTEQPLPADDFDRLARRVIAVNDEEKAALKIVLSEFFTHDGDVYRHERCDTEIAKYRENSSAKARAGKASAEARRKKAAPRNSKEQTKTEHKSTHVEQPLNECATNHKPTTNNHKPLTNGKDKRVDQSSIDHDYGFDEFWKAYPRKTAPKNARKSWMKLKPDLDLQQHIINHINQRLEMLDWDPARKEFIPHPATFINGERWTDEIIDKRGLDNGRPGQTGKKLSHADDIREQARRNFEKLDNADREANYRVVSQDGDVIPGESQRLHDF